MTTDYRRWRLFGSRAVMDSSFIISRFFVNSIPVMVSPYFAFPAPSPIDKLQQCPIRESSFQCPGSNVLPKVLIKGWEEIDNMLNMNLLLWYARLQSDL